MGQDKFSKAHLTLYACGIIPVVWLALLLAPYAGGGLLGLVQYGGAALNDPFHIVLCGDSLKTVLIFLLCYGLGVGVYLSTAGGRNTVPPSGAAPRPSGRNTQTGE